MDPTSHLFVSLPFLHAASVEKSIVDLDPVAVSEQMGSHDVCCHFRHHRYEHLTTKWFQPWLL
jgi:hypothetical protein